MRSRQLLAGAAPSGAPFDPDMEICGISYDSRTVRPGELFVALPGWRTDGHRYIREALDKGAALVLCERPPEGEGPWIRVPDARAALAAVSANWFGHPAEELTVIGVTGTNGKTTTTCLLKEVLERVTGEKAGLIGTNQDLIGDTVLPAVRTTPESWELQRLLRQMADAGCRYVVMEVSSHALTLKRTAGIRFAVGAFTNLTQDHLDFHGTMEAYRAAKGLLFRQCDRAVIDLDDEAGRYYARTAPCPVYTYSERRDEADLTAKNVRLFPDRVEFVAVERGGLCRVSLPIPGGFTIYNALAVLTCGRLLGLGLEEMAQALRETRGVKGRIEPVPVPMDFTVLIDYAHTPDALEKLLITVRDATPGRVICLFGCGGDRDRSKRPVMGAVASALADIVVLTSDNPRSEDPEAILADIRAGMDGSAVCQTEPDRRKAIRLALSLARTGDTVVLAGKGHETEQETAGQKIHLDEREEVAAWSRQTVPAMWKLDEKSQGPGDIS